jgi:hypothetical protein
LIEMLFQMQSLLEHGPARNGAHPTDDDLAALSLAMAIHDIQSSSPTHRLFSLSERLLDHGFG